MGNDISLVLNDPFDDLPLLKIHGFCHSSGEVDVVLIGRLLPLDELHLCRISHSSPPI